MGFFPNYVILFLAAFGAKLLPSVLDTGLVITGLFT